MTIQQENSSAIPSQGHLGYWVGSLASVIRKGLSEELEPFGVTPTQWVILEAAFDGNANTITGLARVIPVDAAGISRQLDKLTDQGLVRRSERSGSGNSRRNSRRHGHRTLCDP